MSKIISGRMSAYATQMEPELVSSARSGDADAFAELWRRTHRFVYAVVRSKTSIDVDDLVAETFAAVWAQMRQGGGPRVAFKAYVAQIARNMMCRSLREFQWAITGIEIEGEPIPDVAEGIEEIESERELVRALKRLPESWQRVIWWQEIDDVTRGEIARRLGISVNAVSALSRRAREGLRLSWLEVQLESYPTSAHPGIVEQLPGLLQRKLTSRREGYLLHHLTSCGDCAHALSQLQHNNRWLSTMSPMEVDDVPAEGLLVS